MASFTLACPAFARVRVTAPRRVPTGRRATPAVVCQADKKGGEKYKNVRDGNLDRADALPLPPTTKNNVLPTEWRRTKKEKQECDARATLCKMDDVIEVFGRGPGQICAQLFFPKGKGGRERN